MYRNVLFVMLWLAMFSNAQAVDITQVYHQPESFFPDKREQVEIFFTLSEPSDVTLNIYDDRDLLIRSIETPGVSTGTHGIIWNGLDQAGRVVPAEAYRYVLTAHSKTGGRAVHDLSDHTGGQNIHIGDIKWDRTKKRFEYILKRPARVLIRVGLKNHGPLLATVTNWLPRGIGKHSESWDGMDMSDVIDLSAHPGMEVDVQAYALSKNTILAGHAQRLSHFVDIDWPEQKREIQKQQKKRMIATQQQAPETRGDYEANLVLPEGLPLTDEGIPIVSGQLPVMLTVDQDKNAIALNRRAEPVFFVDGQFAFENEIGFLPMTWLLNTDTLNEGEHYLSVNLRGYEGNFGLATLKVYVQRPTQKDEK